MSSDDFKLLFLDLPDGADSKDPRDSMDDDDERDSLGEDDDVECRLDSLGGKEGFFSTFSVCKTSLVSNDLRLTFRGMSGLTSLATESVDTCSFEIIVSVSLTDFSDRLSCTFGSGMFDSEVNISFEESLR